MDESMFSAVAIALESLKWHRGEELSVYFFMKWTFLLSVHHDFGFVRIQLIKTVNHFLPSLPQSAREGGGRLGQENGTDPWGKWIPSLDSGITPNDSVWSNCQTWVLCSHKPMGKDGGNCRRNLCVQKGSRGRQWGFKPGSKSWLSVNELQNSGGAPGFWRPPAHVSLLQPFGHNITVKALEQKISVTFCSNGAARE